MNVLEIKLCEIATKTANIEDNYCWGKQKGHFGPSVVCVPAVST
jgi:hypothetical protein